MRVSRALFSTVVLLIVHGTLFTIARAHEIEFRGERIWEPETGFTVFPNKDDKILAVSSVHHHYSLILPYADSWVFETSKTKPLFAQGGGLVASIQIVPKLERSARDKLKNILKNIKASEQGEIKGHSYFEAYGRLALRYQTRIKAPPPELEKLNEWRYTYWTVIERDGKWYALHLTPPPVPPPFHHEIPTAVKALLGIGFRADFDPD